MYAPHHRRTAGEPPSDADFSGLRTNIGTTKKREIRARLRNYLEERLNESASEFVSSFSGTAVDGKTNVPGRADRFGSTSREYAESRNKDVVFEWGIYQAVVDNRRGQIYYHDTITKISSWERPEGFPPYKLSASRRIALEEQSRRYMEWHGGDAIDDREGGEGGDGGDAARAAGGNGVSAVVSESDSNLGTGEVSTAFAPGLEAEDASPPVNNFLDWKRGDLAVVSDSAFETGTAQTNDVVDAPLVAVVVGEGNVRPDQPPTPLITSNMSPALPTMTIDDNGNDVNTLPIVQQGDWSAYFDVKSGLVFYYNEVSGETSWDPPVVDFPRIVMDESGPSVLDPGYGNISMERAIGYIGVDEMAEALAWEEAKKKERTRKAAERGEGGMGKDIYEAAKRAELERIDRDRTITYDAAKFDEMDKQRTERLHVEENSMPVDSGPKRPVPPKVERPGGDDGFLSFWWGRKRTAQKINTLYDVLLCSPGASRDELKRSYLSLAKTYHPDALLQSGVANDYKTERRFTEIAHAWKVLGDPTSRRRYDRELQAKGISSTAGNIFEVLVMGAAQALDEVLAKAEESLER